MDINTIKYHFVFGDSARGSLRYFFETIKKVSGKRIINVSDNFSLGPLDNYESKTGKMFRKKWFDSFFDEIKADEELRDYFEKAVDGIQNEIKDIGKEDKILIWYGNNVNDIIGLMYLYFLLGNEKKRFYFTNVSEILIEDKRGNVYRSRLLGEVHPDKYELFWKNIKLADGEFYRKYQKNWTDISRSKDTLRIMKDGEVCGVEEDYYDEYIINNCTLEFMMCARVIGQAMGRAQALLSDTFVYWRIMKLIKNKRVEARGPLKSMRDFCIRKKQDDGGIE